ncbi:TetR/AcrR family transcriptional regulator [Fibrella aquatilis]|uniref:TetR/AcrR family transcriptional regulator n=1 Tax=Fibrella aquatilis TaxID=2817059 RepID=A0A939K139_9BACT|nr:TetR/AcrR family transcriptional regulator [Fibrella aquatilis]MBO0931870.1 TetR/AcrR family transcriptional regulator [Fibrella aquatilis]
MSELTTTQRRKRREKENRRQLILDTAERLMLATGQMDLNMDQVAHEAELAKGTLYLHFRSKEEILAILTIKVRRLLLQAFQQAVEVEKQPLRQLEALLWACYYFFGKNKLYYNLLAFHESGNHSTDTPELKESSLAITALILDILNRAKAEGSLASTANPMDLAFVIWGTVVGMTQLIDAKSAIMEADHEIEQTRLYSHFVSMMIKGVQ